MLCQKTFKMNGRLKSITLKTSQEAWRVDLPEITLPAAPDANVQHQAPQLQVPITTTRIASGDADQSAPVRRNQKRAASTSEPPNEDNDDDFMPPMKQHAGGRASSRLPGTSDRRAPPESANSKLPSMRCAPSYFKKFCEHLTMVQRRKITELNFGGLLQFSAENPESTDLLIYLMDKLNPATMVLEVGDEGGLEIHDIRVNKVLGLPVGNKDPPSSTEEENERALVQFRRCVHVEPNKDVKCRHLLDLMSKLFIDNDLAVRIFFIVAFNKLLFPAIDNNIRGRDAFLTMDISNFGNINWCKSVVDELRLAAITWRSEKKRSIPGCAIFLIIFYLDNLASRSSIEHFITPRARFFNEFVMERLIREDKRRDRDGRLTYGNLQLKNIGNTCYQYTRQASNSPSAAATHSSSPVFPSAGDLSVLFSNITSSSSRNKAIDGLKRFETKASEAINLMQSGSQMLTQAHKEFIENMWSALGKEPAENGSRDTRDKGPAVENQCSSSEEFSFMHTGGACIKETNPQIHAVPSQFFGRFHAAPSQFLGHEQWTEHTADASFELEDNAQQLQGEAHSNSNLQSAVPADIHGFNQEEHPAPCHSQIANHNSWETIVNSNTFRSTPELGSFAPNIDNIIEDNIQGNETDTDPINHDQVDPMANYSEVSYMASIDHIIPAASADGSSVPITHMYDSAGGMSNDGFLGDIPTFATTQDASGYHIRTRPRIDRLVVVPSRYRSPFKCISPGPEIDMIKARAVRTKFCTELKDKKEYVISGTSTSLNCIDVAESFSDGAKLYRSFMNFFVECIRTEEQIFRPKCVGYRVFLSGCLGEMLNHVEEQHHSQYPDLAALIRLEADIGDIDLNRVKLFFVPIPEDSYYTLYCLNMVDSRIDILDSSNEDHKDHHAVVGDRVVLRLNDLFQKLSNGKFKDFSRWKRPMTSVMKEDVPSDSAFIAAKILQIWDGNKLHLRENQISMADLRSEMLYYMLYHSLNQRKKLPHGLDEYKPLD